jgi:cell division inhibitor SepF
MFAKLAEKLNSKLKNTEEEIEFKEYTEEDETPAAPVQKESAPTVNTLDQSGVGFKNNNRPFSIRHLSGYDEVSIAADDVLEGRNVVMNVEALSETEQCRVLDFLNGMIYAINGDIKFVSKDTYIISPDSADDQDED